MTPKRDVSRLNLLEDNEGHPVVLLVGKALHRIQRLTQIVSLMLHRALVLSSLMLAGAIHAMPDEAVPNMTVAPRAGKVELFPESALRPGMKGVAWTVFQGTKPEPVPVEIVGIWENGWGPRQDIIIGKLTGKAERTNVAGGMSGSPVYIDGKLVGAISLRLSVFSPDAICGITPINLMLEVNEFDKSRPADSRTPDKLQTAETQPSAA